MTEKIILGLDTGTNVMVYAVIIVRASKLSLIQFGVIQMGKTGAHELKLKKIFDRVLSPVSYTHLDVYKRQSQ